MFLFLIILIFIYILFVIFINLFLCIRLEYLIIVLLCLKKKFDKWYKLVEIYYGMLFIVLYEGIGFVFLKLYNNVLCNVVYVFFLK